MRSRGSGNGSMIGAAASAPASRDAVRLARRSPCAAALAAAPHPAPDQGRLGLQLTATPRDFARRRRVARARPAALGAPPNCWAESS